MSNSTINPEVDEAIEELKASFTGHTVEAVADGEGGAFIRLHELLFGDQYEPSSGWVVFHILHAYPHAAIYPHYLPPGVKRRDGKPLGEAIHQKDMDLGPFKGGSTMVSRKSNQWNPAADTAAIKLSKVLDWLRERP